MDRPLFEQLYKCTVRLVVPNGVGTGFFTARPGFILTCAHVVESARDDAGRVTVQYENREFKADSIKFREKPYPDLALLRIDLNEHPCVYLDEQVESGDSLFTYGYTRKYPGGEAATVEYEGPARIDSQKWLLKFKGGQIIPGYSGSPLLNMRTWNVCGVVKSSRDTMTDLGGGGVPTKVVLAELPELIDLQKMFHSWNGDWKEAREQQINQLPPDQDHRDLLYDPNAPAMSPTGMMGPLGPMGPAAWFGRRRG